MEPRYRAVHARAHKFAATLAMWYAKEGEWAADCGAGAGHLGRELEGKGLAVCSLDPTAGGSTVKAGWEALPLRRGSVAVVTACASLQYAADPGAAVRAAAEALRPGGALIVLLSPVHASSEGAREGEATARARTGNPSYRHFDKAEVESHFRSAGLSFKLIPFRLPGTVGITRRLKARSGVEQAEFPTLLGVKGGV
jgi:SAM-dependent methyltransferase